MAQSQIRIKVNVSGVYCVRYLSALNELLDDLPQDQCYVTTTNEGNHYLNLLLPSGSYIIPKIRIYKSYAGSTDFQDVINSVVDCGTGPITSSSSSIPPSTSSSSTSTTSSLPYCGCSGLNSFVINSITYVGAGNYQVVFNACIANPLNWQVRNAGNTVVASGSLVPTSGVVLIPVGPQADGVYTMILTSTACAGTATQSFIITAAGGGGDSTTSTPPIGSSSSTTPSGEQGILMEDFSISGSTGKSVNLTLSEGTVGEGVEISLKQGGIEVGSAIAGYATSMSVISSVYGYVDVFINGADKGTVYIPQRLFGAYVVEESKAVDENDSFMKLIYTQESDGTFTITDSGFIGFSTMYYNINGKWNSSTSINIKLEPNITHSITKFGYNGSYWGDNSAAQNKKQITFKIIPAGAP